MECVLVIMKICKNLSVYMPMYLYDVFLNHLVKRSTIFFSCGIIKTILMFDFFFFSQPLLDVFFFPQYNFYTQPTLTCFSQKDFQADFRKLSHNSEYFFNVVCIVESAALSGALCLCVKLSDSNVMPPHNLSAGTEKVLWAVKRWPSVMLHISLKDCVYRVFGKANGRRNTYRHFEEALSSQKKFKEPL